MHGPFRWSNKWWPGVIPLAILWAVAAWSTTPVVEADLAARSNAALQAGVLDKKQIAVDGRDVTLTAAAFSEEGRGAAVAAVAAVPGVRLV
ncbi:MAG TPA: OmpA family protein, partial [Bradyrhizobium sp.]|nr:OmpA family protein [Bradyrhizobium sp.]